MAISENEACVIRERDLWGRMMRRSDFTILCHVGNTNNCHGIVTQRCKSTDRTYCLHVYFFRLFLSRVRTSDGGMTWFWLNGIDDLKVSFRRSQTDLSICLSTRRIIRSIAVITRWSHSYSYTNYFKVLVKCSIRLNLHKSRSTSIHQVTPGTGVSVGKERWWKTHTHTHTWLTWLQKIIGQIGRQIIELPIKLSRFIFRVNYFQIYNEYCEKWPLRFVRAQTPHSSLSLLI